MHSFIYIEYRVNDPSGISIHHGATISLFKIIGKFTNLKLVTWDVRLFETSNEEVIKGDVLLPITPNVLDSFLQAVACPISFYFAGSKDRAGSNSQDVGENSES